MLKTCGCLTLSLIKICFFKDIFIYCYAYLLLRLFIAATAFVLFAAMLFATIAFATTAFATTSFVLFAAMLAMFSRFAGSMCA